MKLTILQPLIDEHDLRRVMSMLQEAGAFTASFDSQVETLYHPLTYLCEHELHDTSTVLLLDRNVFTRIVGAVRGDKLNDQHRLAAAVMVFALCTGAQIEPSLALYEVAHQQGNDVARGELSLFRRADNSSPEYWTDVALGRIAGSAPLLEAPRKPRRERKVDFELPLRTWRRNYVLCLKLAELALQQGRAETRLRQFIRWAHSDFVLGAAGIALAIHFLAPNARRAGLLKGLFAADREKAIKGVRNAAWDCTLVSHFISAISSQQADNCLSLLVSFDSSVHAVLRTITETTSDVMPISDALEANLSRLWTNPTVSRRLASELRSLYDTIDNPDRVVNKTDLGPSIDELIEQGEARVWTPQDLRWDV